MTEVYTCEINTAPPLRQWMYHKAAWDREDLEQGLGFFYRTLSLRGLESLPGVGLGMAGVVEDLLHATSIV